MAGAATIVTAVVAGALLTLQAETDAAPSTTVTAEATTVGPTTIPPTARPPTTVRPRTATPTVARPATVPTTVPTTTVRSRPEPGPGPVAVAGTLRAGDKGPAVVTLQERLRRLGYWLGTPDGTFGDLTVQAVMAFQKVQSMNPDGIAGTGTAAAMNRATRPAPKGAGDVIEVDKARQVVFVVRAGAVQWVLNTSTGTEQPYAINGRTELADTPPGHWNVTRGYDGVKVGELGALYRPRFFHPDGIAVHGYRDVPAYPASHGCVRVTNAAIDWIWTENLMPIGSSVWVY